MKGREARSALAALYALELALVALMSLDLRLSGQQQSLLYCGPASPFLSMLFLRHSQTVGLLSPSSRRICSRSPSTAAAPRWVQQGKKIRRNSHTGMVPGTLVCASAGKSTTSSNEPDIQRGRNSDMQLRVGHNTILAGRILEEAIHGPCLVFSLPSSAGDEPTASLAPEPVQDSTGPSTQPATDQDTSAVEETAKSDEYNEIMNRRMGTSLSYRHELGLDYNSVYLLTLRQIMKHSPQAHSSHACILVLPQSMNEEPVRIPEGSVLGMAARGKRFPKGDDGAQLSEGLASAPPC
eukprot:scaffold22318_cov19-Tisochrysis_lutea.AAC.1